MLENAIENPDLQSGVYVVLELILRPNLPQLHRYLSMQLGVALAHDMKQLPWLEGAHFELIARVISVVWGTLLMFNYS